MKEEWRKVEGGWYEVSNLGRVRRAKPGQGTWVGRLLRPALVKHSRRGDESKYKRVMIRKGAIGNQVWKLVHVLVAEAFIGPRPKGKEVNHIDGNKMNCKVSNLEWKTPSGNAKHAYQLGLRHAHPKFGADNPAAKFTASRIARMRKLYSSGRYTQKQIASIFGTVQQYVSDIVLNRTWKAA